MTSSADGLEVSASHIKYNTPKTQLSQRTDQTFLAGITYMLFIYAHWDVPNEDKDDQSITESMIEEDLMNL